MYNRRMGIFCLFEEILSRISTNFFYLAKLWGTMRFALLLAL